MGTPSVLLFLLAKTHHADVVKVLNFSVKMSAHQHDESLEWDPRGHFKIFFEFYFFNFFIFLY